jgi:anti-anti-sigma factor
VVIASILGEIDLSNAALIGREFTQIPNRALGLVVDIRGVEYLDSTAIALLYELHLRLERRGQQLVIVVPSAGSTRRVLELAAFDKQASLAEEMEAAIAAVREAGSGPAQ